MKYLSIPLVFIMLLAASCKKGNDVKISSKNASLIVGKWQAAQQHTLVYDIDDNTLLKDTVVKYETGANVNWWFELYDVNGNAYVTGKPYNQNGVIKPDTTSFLKYYINGSNITLKPNEGGTSTKSILLLSETNMALENVFNGFPRVGWGLDFRTEYHFVEQTFYTKQ